MGRFDKTLHSCCSLRWGQSILNNNCGGCFSSWLRSLTDTNGFDSVLSDLSFCLALCLCDKRVLLHVQLNWYNIQDFAPSDNNVCLFQYAFSSYKNKPPDLDFDFTSGQTVSFRLSRGELDTNYDIRLVAIPVPGLYLFQLHVTSIMKADYTTNFEKVESAYWFCPVCL